MWLERIKIRGHRLPDLKKRIKQRDIKISLALGGGGARGFAHIGALKVLEENQIHVCALAGTSFGSIIGGLYALCPSAASVEEKSVEFLSSSAFNRIKGNYLKGMARERRRAGIGTISLSRPAFIKDDEYLRIMTSIVGNKSFEDTKIPFAATATDILNGRAVIFDSGALDIAFAASCSIPGIFPPVLHDNRLLVDGGWSARVPIEAAGIFGTDIIIAVDTTEGMIEEIDLGSGLGILLRSDMVARYLLSTIQLKSADIIIRPDLKGIFWDSFHKAEEAAMAGEEATRKVMGEIIRP